MADPREVHVQVVLHPGGPNGDFHFESTDLPIGPGNVLYFKNFGYPGFHVHYDLKEHPEYLFPEPSLFPPNPPNQHLRQALFAQGQSGCPSTMSNWGQFDALDVKNAGRTLVVWNKNQTPQDFGYTLRVTKDRGATYLPLDPCGVNQNGSYRAGTSSLLVAAGCLVAGSLLTLGVQAALQG